MASTKAELEVEWNEYHRFYDQATQAISQGRYDDAIRLASQAWPFVDGMMQFGKRFRSVAFQTVGAIDIVLKYAPALLDKAALDQLEELLKRQKRIDRVAEEDLAARLVEARLGLDCAYCLWDTLEKQGVMNREAFLEKWKGSKRQLEEVGDVWSSLGIVTLINSGGTVMIAFATRMDATSQAKCGSCGVVAKAPKVKFLENQRCPRCNTLGPFVVLDAVASVEANK